MPLAIVLTHQITPVLPQRGLGSEVRGTVSQLSLAAQRWYIWAAEQGAVSGGDTPARHLAALPLLRASFHL